MGPTTFLRPLLLLATLAPATAACGESRDCKDIDYQDILNVRLPDAVLTDRGLRICIDDDLCPTLGADTRTDDGSITIVVPPDTLHGEGVFITVESAEIDGGSIRRRFRPNVERHGGCVDEFSLYVAYDEATGKLERVDPP